MPFETCSAHAPWPEQTSPLSNPTGQAIVHVMMRAYLSRRRPLVIVACRWLLSVRLGLGGSPPARGDGRALPERGPALLLNIWLRRDAAHVSMRVGVRPEALPQRTPLHEPPHETRTWVFSPPSSRRASRRPTYEAGRVSKAAAPNCSNLLQSKD